MCQNSIKFLSYPLLAIRLLCCHPIAPITYKKGLYALILHVILSILGTIKIAPSIYSTICPPCICGNCRKCKRLIVTVKTLYISNSLKFKYFWALRSDIDTCSKKGKDIR